VGRVELEVQRADLNSVLQDAIEMVGARRPDSHCTIAIPRRLPHVRCDSIRVSEIYSNLLSNAIKYRRDSEARIEVGFIASTELAQRPDAPDQAVGHVIFYVRDEGIGIERRHWAQVFRLFKRLHGRDEYGGGVGAGLTIVQKLVERHGGCVWLDSSIGVGTTFYFTLPPTPAGTT